MIYKLITKIKNNFTWVTLTPYINGWVPKFALFIPIIGYLILFNDSISDKIQFSALLNSSTSNEYFLSFSSSTRLKLLYFGLIFLGISNFFYHLIKPAVFNIANIPMEYLKLCIENFTLKDFEGIHLGIQKHGPQSSYGQYDPVEWTIFKSEAAAYGNTNNKIKDSNNINWESAKQKHGNLLRLLLLEQFYGDNVGRQKRLITLFVASTIGYILLLLPSLDLFIQVTKASFL